MCWNFDWLNNEIGWKMTNAQLLFCTLYDNIDIIKNKASSGYYLGCGI